MVSLAVPVTHTTSRAASFAAAQAGFAQYTCSNPQPQSPSVEELDSRQSLCDTFARVLLLTIRHAAIDERARSPAAQPCAAPSVPVFIAFTHLLVPCDDRCICKGEHDPLRVRITLLCEVRFMLIRGLRPCERVCCLLFRCSGD